MSSVVTVSLFVLSAACATDPPRGATTSRTPGVTTQSPPAEISADDYDSSLFNSSSTSIDNTWLPLQPGTQFVYQGSTAEEETRVHHRQVFTVTDLTKVIDGVRTVVIWDRDYSEGELVEAELALFAQDRNGNIWHFGQYPEEYEDGEVVDAPAWVAGFAGARPGVTIRAEPLLGSMDYSQGFAPPPINWIDRARVYRMGVRTCVPFGCFENVLVTEEFEQDKPGAYQLKFYAPSVGNVRVGWRGANEDEREVLVLVDLVHLAPEAVAKARAEALALEKRAYTISKGVWDQTTPSEVMGP
jgi:hypothetical protein